MPALLPNLGTRDVEPVRDVAMDGAIIYSCSPVDEHVEWLRRRHLPLVLVDQPPDDLFPSVNVADRAGACAAATHLVEFGHRVTDEVVMEPTPGVVIAGVVALGFIAPSSA